MTVVMGADTAGLDPTVEHGATRVGGGGEGLLKPARKPVCRILVGVLGIMSWTALDTYSSDVLKTLLTPLEIYIRGSGWQMLVGRWGTQEGVGLRDTRSDKSLGASSRLVTD